MTRKRRSFTEEYKAEVVTLIREHGRTVGQVCEELDLTESAVLRWMQRAAMDAGHGAEGALTTAEREEFRRVRRELKVVRMERDLLRGDGLLRERIELRFRFMEAEKANVPIALMGRVLEVSRSGYYAWRNRAPCARSQTDGKLKVNIGAIHERSRGTYGVPRVHAELEASGVALGRKRVARLMGDLGVAGVSRRKATRTTKRDRQRTWLNPISAPMRPIGCGWPTSRTVRPVFGDVLDDVAEARTCLECI